MTTLDQFFSPTAVKAKRDTGIDVVQNQKCSNPLCGKEISPREPKYILKVKGEEKPYCQTCGSSILHKENPEKSEPNE